MPRKRNKSSSVMVLSFDEDLLSQKSNQIYINQDSYSNCSSKLNSGRWTKQECQRFCERIILRYSVYPVFGKDWQAISRGIPSRNPQQVRSHAQKYLTKLKRKQNERKQRQEIKRRIILQENQRLTRNGKYPAEPSLSSLDSSQSNNRALRKSSTLQSSSSFEDSSLKNIHPKDNDLLNSFSCDMQEANVYDQPIMKENKNYDQIQIPIAHFRSHEPNYNEHSLFIKCLLPFLLEGLPEPIFIQDNNKVSQYKTKTNSIYHERQPQLMQTQNLMENNANERIVSNFSENQKKQTFHNNGEQALLDKSQNNMNEANFPLNLPQKAYFYYFIEENDENAKKQPTKSQSLI